MKDFAPAYVSQIWSYIGSQGEHTLKDLPVWLAKMITELGMDAALDLTYEITKSYTGKHIYEEMQGFADGSGCDYLQVRRLNMIAGLTQGHFI